MHHFLLKPLTHDPSQQPAIVTGHHDERCLVAVVLTAVDGCQETAVTTTTTTTVLWPFFQDHPCEPVSEENFSTFWCYGRLREADTQTIRLEEHGSAMLFGNF